MVFHLMQLKISFCLTMKWIYLNCHKFIHLSNKYGKLFWNISWARSSKNCSQLKGNYLNAPVWFRLSHFITKLLKSAWLWFFGPADVTDYKRQGIKDERHNNLCLEIKKSELRSVQIYQNVKNVTRTCRADLFMTDCDSCTDYFEQM